MAAARWRRWAATGAAVAVLCGAAGCTGQAPAGKEPTVPAAGTSGPPVLVPGRPGEPNTVVPPDQAKVPDEGHNDKDVWFVRAMIPHHAQAIAMAALAESRASNQQVRSLAARIKVAQDGEIAQLRSWLRTRGLDDRLGHHEHAAMRGMQSEAAMRELATASGRRFDRMFVAMMSEHHRGAIDMATEVLKGGKDGRVEQLATEISAEQTSEIARLREALAS